MEQFELYSKLSAECLEASQTAKDEAERWRLVEMAVGWHDLSENFAKSRGRAESERVGEAEFDMWPG